MMLTRDRELTLVVMLCEALDEFFSLAEEDTDASGRVLRYLRSRYGDFFLASEASEAGGGKK